MSKILHLKAENIQRIKVVEITPTGNLVVVGGSNGNGKTSLLDSIMFFLGGKKALSDMPVREGTAKGSVTMETEDFVGTKTIYPDGKQELELRPKKELGMTPQKFFDSIASKLTFDPLAFANMEKKDQVEVVKRLIPFDFSGNETFRKTVYNERTFVNRERDAKIAENEATPFDPSFPVDAEPFDLHELESISQQEVAKVQLEAKVAEGKKLIVEANAEQELLRAQIEALDEKKAKITKWLTDNEPKLAEFGNLDELVTAAKAKNALQHERNARIHANAMAKNIFVAMQQHKAKSDELTKTIERLDREKISAIENAELPVKGLSFTDDDGVSYGGIPFSVLSGAERLKVSFAMAIALNPSLRIALIRDGSLLDDENLKLISEMAQQHDFQIWLERVGKGEECSVVLEDGCVLENRMEHKEEHAN